jgi:hypothetical protein
LAASDDSSATKSGCSSGWVHLGRAASGPNLAKARKWQSLRAPSPAAMAHGRQATTRCCVRLRTSGRNARLLPLCAKRRTSCARCLFRECRRFRGFGAARRP